VGKMKKRKYKVKWEYIFGKKKKNMAMVKGRM